MAVGSNNVTITVTVDNRTGAGFNAVNNGLQQIRRQINTTNNTFNNFNRTTNNDFRNVTQTISNSGNTIVNHFNNIQQAARGAAGAVGRGGGGGGGLSASLAGVVGVLASAALPSIGALSPMLVGLGAAGGVAALAIDDIKKEAEVLSPALDELRSTASKAITPGIRDMFKDLKTAMMALNPAVTVAGESLGNAARRAGEFAKSPAFQTAFLKNVELGSKWFEDFSDSILVFTQSFLDFGAKSERTLDAFGGGINDVLRIGLPGMFRELERGTEGSAEFFDGLFDAVNTILPALGKFSALFANAFGPLLGGALRLAGDFINALVEGLAPALEALAPLGDSVGKALSSMGQFLAPITRITGTVLAGAIRLVTPLLKNFFDLFAISAPLVMDLAKSIAGPLLSAFNSVFGLDDKANSFSDTLNEWGNFVKNNEDKITEAFRHISNAVITMVEFGVMMFPVFLSAWRTLSVGVLNAIGAIVSGAANAFGWIPGIGEKLKSAEKSFQGFRESYVSGLDKAVEKAEEFRDVALPRLEEGRLKLNITNFQRQMDIARKQLDDPDLTKERRAEINANIERLVKKKESAQRTLDSLRDKTAKIKGDKRQFDSTAKSVRGTGFSSKLVPIAANPGLFWRTIRNIAGRSLGTAFVTVKAITSGITGLFKATGGIVGQAQTGGARTGMTLVGERGPELLDLAPGTRVRSNEDTRSIIGVAPRGDGSAPMHLTIMIGDQKLGDLLVDPIRGAVRRRGGNVQAVLGKG